MEEGAFVGRGGNAPLAPRRVPFPFAAEEEEGGRRSSRSPCSRAARSGLEIMPILRVYALLWCGVSGLRLFRKRRMCESFAPCQAGQADGNGTIAPSQGEERADPAHQHEICAWMASAEGGKQSKNEAINKWRAQCAVTYIGVETTYVREIPFSRFDAAGSQWIISRHILLLGCLKQVSQRWSVGTIFILHTCATLLRQVGAIVHFGVRSSGGIFRQQFIYQTPLAPRARQFFYSNRARSAFIYCFV